MGFGLRIWVEPWSARCICPHCSGAKEWAASYRTVVRLVEPTTSAFMRVGSCKAIRVLFASPLSRPTHHALVLVIECKCDLVGHVLENLPNVRAARAGDEKFPLAISIREEQDLLPIRRPGRRDIVNRHAAQSIEDGIWTRDRRRVAAVGIRHIHFPAVVRLLRIDNAAR